jgi:integrase/recombinase XerD
MLNGEPVRQSLDLTNWEAATKKMRDWELGHTSLVTAREALDKFKADRESMKLSEAMMRKYRNVVCELKDAFGDRELRSITVDDVRQIKGKWKLAPITIQKRMDMVRKFFLFCVDSDWIDKSPARAIATPLVKHVPTLPYTDLEMEKILWAAESIREAHPKMPVGQEKKLKALIFLMRYSGLRISDTVMFNIRRSLKGNKVFLRQEKTNEPVWVPVPEFVVEAIVACDDGSDYPFYGQVGKPKSAITEWQDRLKKVYVMAGIPDGHSHRLRDTFSVNLLQKGASIEDVSRLLGHTSIKTTEKHYAPWVKSRQDQLEKTVQLAWA